MATVDRILSTVDRAWRAHGVAAADRRRLTADLRPDLEQAVADGVDPERLLGGDVGEFARRLADEAGLHNTAPEYGHFVAAALFGALIGGVVGAGVLAGGYALFVALIDLPRGFRVPVPVAVALFYGVPAVAVLAGAIISVRRQLPRARRIRETARNLTWFLPPAAVVITLITMGFARSTGYSTDPAVVLAEVAIPLAGLGVAVVAARFVALRADGRQVPALTEA